MESQTPIQDDILRRMTPSQRLKVAESLYWQARKWKAAGLKTLHPDWTEEQIASEVRKLFLYGTTP